MLKTEKTDFRRKFTDIRIALADENKLQVVKALLPCSCQVSTKGRWNATSQASINSQSLSTWFCYFIELKASENLFFSFSQSFHSLFLFHEGFIFNPECKAQIRNFFHFIPAIALIWQNIGSNIWFLWQETVPHFFLSNIPPSQ